MSKALEGILFISGSCSMFPSQRSEEQREVRLLRVMWTRRTSTRLLPHNSISCGDWWSAYTAESNNLTMSTTNAGHRRSSPTRHGTNTWRHLFAQKRYHGGGGERPRLQNKRRDCRLPDGPGDAFLRPSFRAKKVFSAGNIFSRRSVSIVPFVRK